MLKCEKDKIQALTDQIVSLIRLEEVAAYVFIGGNPGGTEGDTYIFRLVYDTLTIYRGNIFDGIPNKEKLNLLLPQAERFYGEWDFQDRKEGFVLCPHGKGHYVFVRECLADSIQDNWKELWKTTKYVDENMILGIVETCRQKEMELRRVCRQEKTGLRLWYQPIELFEVGEVAYLALKRGGVDTVWELSRYSEEEARRIPGMTEGALIQCQEELRKLGMRFRRKEIDRTFYGYPAAIKKICEQKKEHWRTRLYFRAILVNKGWIDDMLRFDPSMFEERPGTEVSDLNKLEEVSIQILSEVRSLYTKLEQNVAQSRWAVTEGHFDEDRIIKNAEAFAAYHRALIRLLWSLDSYRYPRRYQQLFSWVREMIRSGLLNIDRFYYRCRKAFYEFERADEEEYVVHTDNPYLQVWLIMDGDEDEKPEEMPVWICEDGADETELTLPDDEEESDLDDEDTAYIDPEILQKKWKNKY